MRRAAGFTLLEVMLVILLIGILVSTVVLSFGNDSVQDRLDKEVNRFQQVFQHFAETAELQQQEWGLVVTENSYAFVLFSDDGWQWVETPTAAAAYQLPNGLLLQLELEGLPGAEQNLLSQLEFDSPELTELAEAAVEPPLPKVFMLSSGEISPFRLQFQWREQGETLQHTVGTDFSIPLIRFELGNR